MRYPGTASAAIAARQFSRPLIGAQALRNRKLLGLVDQGLIPLVVYTALIKGVTQVIGVLGRLLTVDAGLLAVVLAIIT